MNYRGNSSIDMIIDNDIPFRDVKFGIQSGSDWPKTGQIWDFLRSVIVHFGSVSQNVLELILKSPRFVPFWGQFDPICMPNLTSLLTASLAGISELRQN